MPARTQQRLLSLSYGPPHAQHDSPLLLANDKHAGENEEHNQDYHHELNDPKTAAQRFGKRLRTGILRHLRRRRRGRGRRRLQC